MIARFSSIWRFLEIWLCCLLLLGSGAANAQLSQGPEAASLGGESMSSPGMLPNQIQGVTSGSGAGQGRPLGDASSGQVGNVTTGESGGRPRIAGTYIGPARTGRQPLTPITMDSVRAAPTAPNDFQQFVAEATGKQLPIYGAEFFRAANGYSTAQGSAMYGGGAVASGGGAAESRFSQLQGQGTPVPGDYRYTPVQGVPVPADYPLGPGDELLIRGWGSVDIDFRAVIDRDGLINIPKVGAVPLVGVRAGSAEEVLRAAIGKVYRGFTLNVTYGQLRGITIYVVGQARRPGTYTVSSLSTLLTALFESGGPGRNGSLRHVQLKRAGKLVAEIDLYAFLARGDKSGDIKLVDGDVIVIPPAGGYVALTGKVEQPGIYELLGKEDSIASLLEIAGGMPLLADPRRMLIEHIEPNQKQPRTVEEVQLDADGLKRELKAGDLVTVFPISAEFANAVAVRVKNGNAFRMPFRPGMKITDLIPNKASLLSRASVTRQNDFGHQLGKQYDEFNWEYAVVERLNRSDLKVGIVGFNLGRALAAPGGPDDIALQVGDTITVFPDDDVSELPVLPSLANAVTLRAKGGRSFRMAFRPGMKITDLIPDKISLLTRADLARQSSFGRAIGEQTQEFNLEYAVVERRSATDTNVNLVGFNLGRALADPGGPENIPLQVGDTVMVFSATDVRLPIATRRVFVRIEGEVRRPGLYQVEPGETLVNMMVKAGGLTPDAYLFGAEFYRESVRKLQQENLDKVVRRAEQQAMAETTKVAVNSSDAQSLVTAQTEARNRFLQGLRELRSSGRMSLGVSSLDSSLAQLPEVRLENDDRLVIPNRPSSVQVSGALNAETSLLWSPGRTVSDYLALSGLTQDSDQDAVFVVRANGTVLSNSDRWFSSVAGLEVMPGDSIVVPEKLIKESFWTAFIRNTKDVTQILYQFGLGAAAIRVLK